MMAKQNICILVEKVTLLGPIHNSRNLVYRVNISCRDDQRKFCYFIMFLSIFGRCNFSAVVGVSPFVSLKCFKFIPNERRTCLSSILQNWGSLESRQIYAHQALLEVEQRLEQVLACMVWLLVWIRQLMLLCVWRKLVGFMHEFVLVPGRVKGLKYSVLANGLNILPVCCKGACM